VARFEEQLFGSWFFAYRDSIPLSRLSFCYAACY
jgi:hypothetical protein